MLTNKDARKLIAAAGVDKVYQGDCCQYDQSPEAFRDALKVGSNAGIYGWNWTLYINKQTREAWFDGYRNVPKF